MERQRTIDEKPYSPESAIFIYKNKEGQHYLESHKFFNGKIGSGKPLRRTTVEKLANEFASKEYQKPTVNLGIIPPNLLYFNAKPGFHSIAWISEPYEQMMNFTENTGVKPGKRKMPGLLFIANNYTSLYIYAVKKFNKQNIGNTALFKAPFHNMFAKNNFCYGTAEVEESNHVLGLIDNYTKMFFLSEFSHFGEGGSPIKTNLDQYWNDALDGRDFDNNLLIPLKININDAIKKNTLHS